MTHPYLIIGAGPAGLAMAASLKEGGIPYEQVEADDGIGGNWYHGVYETLYTDASKDVMQFPDFPMPAHYPDFLSKDLMLEYLNEYAKAYELFPRIRFRTKVIWVQAVQENLWKVHFEDGSSRTYQGVIVCNGHHWNPDMPELPGTFSGEYIHAKAYKAPEQLENKRVLVLGSGNSAADIACEAARVANSSVMSFKSSPWIFPRSFMGTPLGRIKARNGPRWLDPILAKLLIRITFGKYERYGLTPPSHGIFDRHPTVSEELPLYLKEGRISIRPRIEWVENRTVHFEDGSSMSCDLIVAATGYKLSFPFLPEHLARVEHKHLRCVGHCNYPDIKGLFFLGWQQVRGGIGSLAGHFSRTIRDLIRIEEEYGTPSGKVLQEMKNKTPDTHLYGAKDIMKWIEKHDHRRLSRKAKKLANGSHRNEVTEEPVPSDARSMRVY